MDDATIKKLWQTFKKDPAVIIPATGALPCPFCSGEPLWNVHLKTGKWNVVCRSCAAEGPWSKSPSVAMWNRREITAAQGIGMKLHEARCAFDRALIEAAWAVTGGKATKTAELLGISRKSLWELRKKLQLR